MMPDPDDILGDAQQDWIDRIAAGVRHEIIDYFEQRFTSLEEQILSIRRYIAITTFLDYYQRLSDYLDQYDLFVQRNQSTTDQERSTAYSSIDRCRRHIQERYRLILDEIRRNRNPEEHVKSVYNQWKDYFSQAHVPHVDLIYFEA